MSYATSVHPLAYTWSFIGVFDLDQIILISIFLHYIWSAAFQSWLRIGATIRASQTAEAAQPRGPAQAGADRTCPPCQPAAQLTPAVLTAASYFRESQMNVMFPVLWFAAFAGHTDATRRSSLAEGMPRRANGAAS